jgi:hypothetical protein
VAGKTAETTWTWDRTAGTRVNLGVGAVHFRASRTRCCFLTSGDWDFTTFTSVVSEFSRV